MDAEFKKKIENIICDIMINDGPDGHCDGSNIIVDFVEAVMDGKIDEWEKAYFDNGKERYITNP